MATPEENFYRVCHIVLDAIPQNLRDLFIQQWNVKYPNIVWEDRPRSGQNFIANERNQKVKTTVHQNMLHGDSKQFDGTTLFSLLLYSSQKLLHCQPNVKANIDQLRIIRNECFAHRSSTSFTDQDYQTLITDVKRIFQQLGWSITTICDIERKCLNTSRSIQLENDLIAEYKRNKSLETRMGEVEVNVDVVGEKLKSMETTKILVGANKEEIDLLKSNVASSNEIFETRMKLAEIEIRSTKEQLQSNTEKLKSQSDMENRVTIEETRIDLLENGQNAGKSPETIVEKQRKRANSTESIGCDDIDYYRIKKIFGQEWFQPKELVIRPNFIVDQYNISLTIERELDMVLKLAFLGEQTQYNHIKGYLLFDINLKELRPAEPPGKMQIHAALLSINILKIIMFLDNVDGISNAEKCLKYQIKAVRGVEHINTKAIPVTGVIIFPRKPKMRGVKSNFEVLFQDQLSKLDTKMSTISCNVIKDAKTALGKMLDISFCQQHHPETEQEAICRASQRISLQRPQQEIGKDGQITFESIALTDLQKHIRFDLLDGNVFLRGGYGTGKTIAIVSAIKTLINQYKTTSEEINNKQTDFKILYLSAQGLLADCPITFSPFLSRIEKWIKEDFEEDDDLNVRNYIDFRVENISVPVMSKPGKKGEISLFTYILKTGDAEILKESTSDLDDFDVVVLEETHALDASVMKDLIASFEKAASESKERNPTKVWISSNAESVDMPLFSFKQSPNFENKPENLRNTCAIAMLAEAIDSVIVPERFPSVAMPIPATKCCINATYEHEPNDQKRLDKIVELAERWRKWFPKCTLLFIDYEDSTLCEKLQAQSIPINVYEDISVIMGNNNNYIDKPLFLKHSDPVEAIVAGAEWNVFIVHVKISTMNSIKMTKLFSKRVISRCTTKIFIFSDRTLEMTNSDGEDNKTRQENEPSANVDDNDLRRTDMQSSGDTDNGHLIAHLITEHYNMISSGKKLWQYEDYMFTQIGNLDNTLGSKSQDIYLVCCSRGYAFLVQLSPDKEDRVKEAQYHFDRIWKVRLSAYSGEKLVSYCVTTNFSRISKLCDLLQSNHLSSNTDDRSGFISVNAEDAGHFAGKAKLQHRKSKASPEFLSDELTEFLGRRVLMGKEVTARLKDELAEFLGRRVLMGKEVTDTTEEESEDTTEEESEDTTEEESEDATEEESEDSAAEESKDKTGEGDSQEKETKDQ